jgi:hypothetical protein
MKATRREGKIYPVCRFISSKFFRWCASEVHKPESQSIQTRYSSLPSTQLKLRLLNNDGHATPQSTRELQNTVNDIEKDDKIKDTNTEQMNRNHGELNGGENNSEGIPIGLLPSLDANQDTSIQDGATIGSNCTTPEPNPSTKEPDLSESRWAPESPLSNIESVATPTRSSGSELGKMPQASAKGETVGTNGANDRETVGGGPGGCGQGISTTAVRGTVGSGQGGQGCGRGGQKNGMRIATDEPQ